MEINIFCEKCGGKLLITQSYAEGGDLSLHVAPCDCEEFYRIKAQAIDYARIVEQFQKLLGVFPTTEALAKVAVLMREETEAEEFIRKVRDGLFHYKNHPDEPCSCNENAAAEFMSGLTPRSLDSASVPPVAGWKPSGNVQLGKDTNDPPSQ